MMSSRMVSPASSMSPLMWARASMSWSVNTNRVMPGLVVLLYVARWSNCNHTDKTLAQQLHDPST